MMNFTSDILSSGGEVVNESGLPLLPNSSLFGVTLIDVDVNKRADDEDRIGNFGGVLFAVSGLVARDLSDCN